MTSNDDGAVVGLREESFHIICQRVSVVGEIVEVNIVEDEKPVLI